MQDNSIANGVAGENLVPVNPFAKKEDTPIIPNLKKQSAYKLPTYSAEQLAPFNQPTLLDLGKGSKYDEGLLPFDDLNEHRAQEQTISDRIGNAIPRLLLTAGTKLGTGIGYIGGAVGAAINGIGGGSLEESMEIMLNNGWSTAFSNIEEDVKEALPIYKTRDYLNGDVWKQMTTASFWTDDAIDGVAFMASAYVPGILASKLGTGLKAATLFSDGLKSAKLGKTVTSTAKLIELEAAIGKATATGNLELAATLTKSLKAATNLQKLAKTIDWATTTALATTSEAGFEAKDTKDQILYQLTEIDETTGQPTGKYKLKDGTEITQQEAKHIAAKGALGTYSSNLLALALSNGFEASQLLNTFGNSRKLLKTAAATGAKEIMPLTLGTKLKSFGFNALKTSVAEGAWEENIQLAIQNYEKSSATGENKLGRAESLLSNWLDNFTTDEGLKSIMLGSIIGLIPGGYSGMRQSIADNQQASNLLNAINANKRFTFGRALEFLKKDKDGNVIINKETKQLELDLEKAKANYDGFKGAAMNLELANNAVQNDDKVFHEYLNNNRVADWGYDYFSSEEGTDMFDTDIEFHAKMEAEGINEINRQLKVGEQTPEQIATHYKAKAKQYKRIYDSVVNNDAFIAKLGNSKVDQQLKADLTKSLFREAVNQVNLGEAKNKLIVQQSQVLTDRSAASREDLAENSPELKAYDKLQKTIDTVDELLGESQGRYAALNDPSARKIIRKKAIELEEENEAKRVRAEQYTSELAFKESIIKNLVKEGLDENNNHAAIEGLLKEAKSKNIKNAQALIDERLAEIIREKNNDTHNDEFKTTATPEELAEAEKVTVVTDSPVEKKNIGENIKSSPSTFTYTNPKTKVSTTYSPGNDIVYLGTQMKIIAIGDKITLVDKSKANTHKLTPEKLIEYLDSQIDQKVAPKKDTTTQPTKQTNAQVLDRVKGLSGIKKDSTMDKLLHWYDVDIKAIRYDISGELASIKKASQKNRLEMLDSMLQLLQIPQTANDKAVRARINAVLESFGYDVNEQVVDEGFHASLPSTGESVKDQDIPIANYTKEETPRIILQDEASFTGVKLSLTDYKLDDITEHQTKEGDILLDKEETERYKLLQTLKSGTILNAQVDIDWINSEIFKSNPNNSIITVDNIPIQLTHKDSDSKAHINTVQYLTTEINLSDILIYGSRELNIKLNEVLAKLQSAKTLSARGELLWKYFGKSGTFTKNSKLAPLYEDKTDIVPTDLEGYTPRVAKVSTDIFHITRLIVYKAKGKTAEEHFNNLSNWKNRLKADLQNSLSTRQQLFDEYQKGNTKATIPYPIESLSSGSIEKTAISRPIHEVFGDMDVDLIKRVESYRLVTIPPYVKDTVHDLYDVHDQKTKENAGTILHSDKDNDFIPGRLYLLSEENLNGSTLPIILDINTWTKEDDRFGAMMDKIHSIINTYHDVNETRLNDIRQTALELNEYINVILEKSSNSKEFRIVGSPYEEGGEVNPIIQFIDANSKEYNLYVRDEQGVLLPPNAPYRIVDTKGKLIDKPIEDLMVGKFKNVVYSKLNKASKHYSPTYKQELLVNNEVVSTRVAQVLDNNGKKIGLAQIEGRYPYTVSINTSNISLKSKIDEIERNRQKDLNKLKDGIPALITNKLRISLGEYGFTSEQIGNMTPIVANESFINAKYNKELATLIPTVAKSTPVQISTESIVEKPIIVDSSKVSDIERRRNEDLPDVPKEGKSEFVPDFGFSIDYSGDHPTSDNIILSNESYPEGITLNDYLKGKGISKENWNRLDGTDRELAYWKLEIVDKINNQYDAELANLSNLNGNTPTSSKSINKPLPKPKKKLAIDNSKFGLLQAMPVSDYAESYFNDTLGVNSNTKTGTILNNDTVLKFVNEYGTSLDNEFIQVLKNNIKDLKIIVDNEETADDGSLTISYYDPTTQTIGINFDYFLRGSHENFKSAFAHAFSHENIHVITLNASGDIIVNEKGELEVTNPTEFYNDMTELLNITKEAIGDTQRGTKDTLEFIAELISNPLFQSKVKTISYKDENLSVWGKFISYVKQLFQRLLGLSTENSVFDKALELLRNQVSTGISITNVVSNSSAKIKLTTQLTENAAINPRRFTAKEMYASIDLLLGTTQKIVFGYTDEETGKFVLGDRDTTTLEDLLDDPNKGLLTKLEIEIATLRNAMVDLMEDDEDNYYEPIILFYDKILDDLVNNTGDNSLYNYTKAKFSTIHGINITDYDDISDIAEAIDRDENQASLTKGWDDKNIYSKSTTDTFQPLTKIVISTLPIAEFDEDGSVIMTPNEFTGTIQYVNFSNYKYKLLDKLNGMSSYDEMYFRLNEMAIYVPTIHYLIKALKEDSDVQAAFYRDMNKQFMDTDIFLNRTGISGKNTIDIDTQNKKHGYDIANSWINTFKYNIQNKNITNESLDIVATSIKELPSLIVTDYKKALSELSKVLAKFNIIVSANYINLHLISMRTNQYRDSELSIDDQNVALLKQEYTTRLTNIGLDARKMIASKDKIKTINTNSDFVLIAESLAKYTFDFIEPSAPNIHGDIEFGYRAPNRIGDFKGAMRSTYPPVKEKFLNKLKELALTPEGQNSNWLWNHIVYDESGKESITVDGFLIPTMVKHIVTDAKGKQNIISVPNYKDIEGATLNQNFIDNFDIRSVGGIKNISTGEGKTYTELTELDFRLTSLLYYVANKDKTYVKVPGLILADSSQALTYNVRRIPLRNKDIFRNDPNDFELVYASPLFRAMQNVATQEIKRVNQARELLYKPDGTLRTIDELKTSGVYDHLLENFHYTVDKKTKALIFEKNGKPVGNAFKFFAIPTLNEDHSSKVAKSLYSNGILFDNDELQNEANKNTVNAAIKLYVKELVATGNEWFGATEFKPLVEGKYSHIANGKYHEFIAEMMLNQFIANVEQQNFFSGGTAEFSGVLDTVKRIKGLTSPGNSSSPSGISKVMMADEISMQSLVYNYYENIVKANLLRRGLIEGSAKYKAIFEETLKDYKSIDIADGQGWISDHAYITREIEEGRGRDIKSLIEQESTSFGLRYKFKANLKLADYKKSGVIPQVKKFFSSNRKYDAILNRFVEDQFKYSSVRLSDELVRDNDLARLRDYMKAHDIDEFVLRSTKKEGIKPLNPISNDGRLAPDFDFSTLSVHEYDNETRRVQLNVPDGIRDKKSKIGVQERVHIISNVNPSNTYILNNEPVSGEYIITEYNNLITQNIEESAQNLLKDITLDTDITTIDKQKISNLLVAQFKSRNRTNNTKLAVSIDKATGDFEQSLSSGAYRKSIMSVLTSLFTKAVNDQKINGGHAVLISNAFLGSATNKMFAPQDVRDDYRLTVKPENINGQEALVVEAMLPAYSEKFFNLGEQIDVNSLSDELRRIIGFRIPTSKKSNIMILKIVKFLDVGVGSSIIVADEVVAQMNSDFDVDSMYLMMPAFDKTRGISEATNLLLAKNLDNIAVELTADGVDSYVPALYNPESTPDNKVAILGIAIQSVLSKNAEDRTDNDNKFLDSIRNSFNQFTDTGITNELPAELVTSNYIYDKWSPDNNTTNSRNNRILEITMSIMGNDAHIGEIINPDNFAENKWITADLKSIIPSENDEYNPVNPISQLRIRRKAVNGKNNILPIAANYATGIDKLQLLKAKIGAEDGSGIIIKYSALEETSKINEETKEKLTPEELIDAVNTTFEELKATLRSKVNEEDIKINEDNKTIHVIHRNIAWNKDGSFHDVRGRLYTEVVGENVTNAADTLKGDLPANLTPYTFNVWATIQATSGDTRYAGYFINQAGIRLLNYYKERSSGLFEKNSNQEMHNAIKRVHTDIFKELVAAGDITITPKTKVGERYIQYSKRLVDKLSDRIDQFGLMYWYTKPDKKGVSEKDELTTLLSTLLAKYDITYDPTASVYLSKEELRDQIIIANKTKLDTADKLEHLVTQLGILNTWSTYNDHAKDISNAIRILNVDKLGLESSFEGTKKLNADIAKQKDNTNLVSEYTGVNVATTVFELGYYKMLGAFKTNSNDLAMKLIAPLFITEHPQFRAITDTFRAQYGMALGQKSDYVLSRLENYMMQYLVGDHPFLKMSRDEQRRILGVDLQPGEKSTAMKVKEMALALNITSDDVHILSILNPDVSPTAHDINRFHIINTRLSRYDKLVEDEILDSMTEMYYEGGAEQKELVEELIKYAYITNGLSFGRNNFVHLIDIKILKDIGINQHIKDGEFLINNFDPEQDYFPADIADRFILTNTDNYALVPAVWAEISYRDDYQIITKNNTPTWEPNKTTGIIGVKKSQLSRVDNSTIQNATYIKKYYKPKGEEDSYYIVYAKDSDLETETHVYYVPVSRWGGKNVMETYHNPISIFDDNNATTKRNSNQPKTSTQVVQEQGIELTDAQKEAYLSMNEEEKRNFLNCL